MNYLLQPGPPLTFLVSFLAVLISGPAVIEGLRRLKMRQPIGMDAPQPDSHQLKQGTPTMGGVLFIFGVLAAMLAVFATRWAPLNGDSIKLLVVVVVLLLHMGLGFVDDYLKATRGKAMGLKAREKLIGQLVIAVGFVAYLAINAVPGVTTTITLFHDFSIDLSPWLYYPLVVILMIGLSNSVNLTDGLDGLAAGLAVSAFIGLALTGFGGPNSEVALFGWAMAGSCLGFIVYNGFPARVFMGDTGSLAIGASLAALAVLTKEEIQVLVFSLVYILETLSVMAQVVSYKLRGKRIFKMAPVHHHFELCGWKEVQVVQRFWIAGVVLLWLGTISAYWLSPYSVR